MQMLPLFAVSVLIGPAFVSQEHEPSPLALTHVTVLTMEDPAPFEDRTVIVRGDRVTTMGPSSEVELPTGARVIDGKGKYLLPGLCDMHVHLTDARDGLLYVANGVTTIRNLSGQPYHLDLAELYLRGDLPGPTLLSSGPQVRLEEDTPEDEAAAIVAQHQAQGFASVKLYGRMTLDQLRAMAAASKELGFPLDGHVPRNLTLEEAMDSGAYREISHAEEMLYSFFNRRAEPAADVMQECVSLFEGSTTYVTPTLGVYREILPQITDLDGVLARPEMRFLPPLGHVVFGPLNKYAHFDEADMAPIRVGSETLAQLTRALHEASVPLLLGTDAMNPSVIPGFSIHDELRNLVAAGLTPLEALACGTTTAATFLGLEDEVGRVAVGQRADLLLLDANPLEDIAHTRGIAGVVLRGRWLSGEHLRKSLDEQVAGYAIEAAAMARLDRADPGPLLELLAASENHPPESFFLSLASIYTMIRAPQAAADVLDHALDRLPDSALLRNRKAEVLIALGHEKEARGHYERALELEPTNAVARRGLGH